MSIKQRTILFLCTGNSCRSQMAEGFAKKRLSFGFNVISAGIEAHGINPRATRVMREVGIDISTQHSTQVDTEMIQSADIIVTLCGHAKETCPILPSTAEKMHWPLTDPAQASGSEEQIMMAFQSVRDEIQQHVEELAQQLQGKAI